MMTYRYSLLHCLFVLCYLLSPSNVAMGQDDDDGPASSSSPVLESACPNVVKRAQWGAAKSTNVTYQVKPVAIVIVHHTAGVRCTTVVSCKEVLRNIQSHHQVQNRWSDIGYNFLISTGNIYEGIGWHRKGAHLRGFNDKSIGVAFMGNFEQDRPTARSLELLARLLQCGKELGELAEDFRLYGARQLQSTLSPGRWLYMKLKNFEQWQVEE
uniref:Peptidoglycan-recognition protein n=1 Tax=Anopheles culicifacies TaxID=139723 RepID=A0A182MJF3_9DIPT